MFTLGDRVFLDASNIKTMQPSTKLLYQRLEPFIVEQQVGPIVYCLKLSYIMKKLYPVFNVVKLSATLTDLILGWRPNSLSLSIIVDREKEWKVEEILNNH